MNTRSSHYLSPFNWVGSVPRFGRLKMKIAAIGSFSKTIVGLNGLCGQQNEIRAGGARI
jgi:hypothetical protein